MANKAPEGGETRRPQVLSPSDEWLSLIVDRLDSLIDRLPPETAAVDARPPQRDRGTPRKATSKGKPEVRGD